MLTRVLTEYIFENFFISSYFPFFWKFVYLLFDKVKQIISWLRILCCNSLTHFKLQVVDIMTFQTKFWTKSSIFFPKKLFYQIKTIFRCQNKFLFYLEKWLFSNHSHPGTKSDCYWLNVIFRQNGNVFSKEHFSKCLAKCHF